MKTKRNLLIKANSRKLSLLFALILFSLNAWAQTESIIKGGDFSEGSEVHWTKVRLLSENYDESYMTIANGVMKISFPQNTNIGYYQPIQLKAGATYKFSADFVSDGGCTSGRFFFSISQREPYEGEYFEEEWGMYAMTDSWTGSSTGRNLKDPLSGSMPEICGWPDKGMNRNGEFVPEKSGTYYFVVAAVTWSGEISRIEVDNILITMIDEGPGDEPDNPIDDVEKILYSILSPRSHEPAFIEPGGTFKVELRGEHAALSSEWKAVLKNDLHQWEAEITSLTQGTIHHGTEDGATLEIAVPATIPPELMGLYITNPEGVEFQSARSVSIIPDFEESFYIVHQSDQHTNRTDAVEPGGKSSTTWGNGSKQALQWVGPIVNVINPRFVLQSGDNTQTYNDATSWAGLREGQDRILMFMDGFADYQVPTVAIPGNHDIGYSDYAQNYEWRKIYLRVIGKTTFSFKMGSFYFLGSEWTNSTFIDWAKNDYQTNYENPDIKYRLLTSHYYDGLTANSTVAPEDKPANMLLVGHNHTTRVMQASPYPVLSVGSALEYQRGAFYFFNRNETGWSSEQATNHANGVNVHRLVGDWGAPTVSTEFSAENDGTAESNQVNIDNTFPHNFFNGRIRFLMKKGSYDVTGGEILAEYDYDEGTKTAVVVKVDIQESATTQVSIEKKAPSAVGNVDAGTLDWHIDASSMLHLKAEKPFGKVKIYNAAGLLISEMETNDNKTTINLKNNPEKIYIVRTNNETIKVVR